MAANLNSENISKITDAEKKITGQDNPVKGGPTSASQAHAGEPINSDTLHDITEGEKRITGKDGPIKGGPTAKIQAQLSGVCTLSSGTDVLTYGSQGSQAPTSNNEVHTGKLDSSTISKITEAEKQITGQDDPVKGGPTAQATSHAGESINSNTLHDITEGEKKITGGERVKSGPTSTTQAELAKSRQT